MAAVLAAVLVAGSIALAVLRPGTVTRATSGPLATDTRAVKVPGLGATLHEHPSDPLRMTSFLRGSMELSEGLAFSAGLRAVGGDTFRPSTSRMLPLVSPTGDRTAAVHESPGLAVENAGGVRFTDRDLGGEFWVHVVDPPLALRNANWSEEGDRLLVTVFDTTAEDRTVGFAVVDVAGRTATVTRQGAPESGKANYAWGPDEGTVARAAGADRISVHALDGSVRRTIEQAALADGEVPQFSAGPARRPVPRPERHRVRHRRRHRTAAVHRAAARGREDLVLVRHGPPGRLHREERPAPDSGHRPHRQAGARPRRVHRWHGVDRALQHRLISFWALLPR